MIPLPMPAGRNQEAALEFHLPPDSFINSFDWMPDGRHVMASVGVGFSAFSLSLGDVQSKAMESITGSELFQSAPSVSPARRANRIQRVYLELGYSPGGLRLAGSDPTGGKRAVRWLARLDAGRGSSAAFTTNRTGSQEIWWKSLREGWERPLLTPASFDDHLRRVCWRRWQSLPDGRTMVYQRCLRVRYPRCSCRRFPGGSRLRYAGRRCGTDGLARVVAGRQLDCSSGNKAGEETASGQPGAGGPAAG